jgi:hypothetical protein
VEKPGIEDGGRGRVENGPGKQDLVLLQADLRKHRQAHAKKDERKQQGGPPT